MHCNYLRAHDYPQYNRLPSSINEVSMYILKIKIIKKKLNENFDENKKENPIPADRQKRNTHKNTLLQRKVLFSCL